MNTNTLLLLALVIIGAFLVLLQFKLSDEKCPPDKVIYKYVPRTFQEEQRDPVKVSELFSDMFLKDPIII